jgi:hypothetical protein
MRTMLLRRGVKAVSELCVSNPATNDSNFAPDRGPGLWQFREFCFQSAAFVMVFDVGAAIRLCIES